MYVTLWPIEILPLSSMRGTYCASHDSESRERFPHLVLSSNYSAVLVRRVVEARRLHYQQQQPQQSNPSDQKVTSIARTPALPAPEANGDGHNGVRRRRDRLLRVFKRAGKKKTSEDEETEGEEHMKEKSKKEKDRDKRWWRRKTLCW